VDVAVCDGFVGNIVLKTSEAVAKMIAKWLKTMFRVNPVRMVGALLSRGVFREMKSHADPANHGGAPLLGANGVVIIGHGSSNALATFNGIRVAAEAIDHDVNHLIEAELKRINAGT
jgi:glycerol-3-phosphate acyltransferase PlsX